MSELSIRSIGPDEFEAYRACVSGVFGDDPDGDPDGAARARTLIPPGRAFAAFDGATIVATAANLAFIVNVCGKTLPMAGLTTVTVRPTYRRRGLLRALMRQTLLDTARAGESLSRLRASDGAIYGRFGYGVAAEGDELEIVGDDGFANDRELDTVIALDDATALATRPAIHDQALAVRPGLLSRSHDHWRLRRIADRPSQRKGRSPRRHVVTRRGAARRSPATSPTVSS